ncbi:AI-2E family transporter [Actinomadura sp. 7K534]|uniref:AI-2E family transporter n=1 Tax=Actinomadura sp. 7K534 TaxID=2530366 RepID=UPI0010473B76|nr:AI-2E family transporter [Actinomadura sp. 7K534]TDB95128.1 AI-2E family transporter [Actinomadura sp. 7K534]
MTSRKGFDAVPPALRNTAAVAACILVIVAALGVLIYLALKVASLVMAVISALLLTALVAPVARQARRLRAPAWVAALAGLLTVIVAVGGSIALVTNQVTAQWPEIRGSLSQGLQRAQTQIVNTLPINDRQLDDAVNGLLSALRRGSPDPVAGASMATRVAAAVLIALFLLFFMLKDGRSMWEWVLRLVPEQRRAKVDVAGLAGWRALGQYVRGIVLVALADAVGIGLALVLIGVPFALPLALLTFVAAFVPIIGAVVAGAAAVLIAFVSGGLTDALLVLAAVLAVQQAESHLLQPLIMGRTLHLHPVVVVVAVAAGTLAAGIAGAVVAVPLVAVVYRIARVLADDDTDPETGPGPARDPAPETAGS